MEPKKNFLWIIVLIIFGLFFLFGVVDCSLSFYIKANGTPKTVTVTFQELVYVAHGSPTDRSCGYYYVNNKRYKAFRNGKVPIGTKFEIKYFPKIPGRWEYMKDIIQ